MTRLEHNTPALISDTPVWCIAGPTAAGKSALCTKIADILPAEFINVDSATIYQGMDIGTAKPDAEERSRLKHHLLDIVDPAQAYSVARFYDEAIQLIAEIRARNHIPILVGGTMMYYHTLMRGLAELPSADPAVRAQIEAQALQIGWPAMHQKLQQIDPDTAARLAPADKQRIGRALEVYQMTGKPLSVWLQSQTTPRPAIPLHLISLEPSERQKLHHRIEMRFDEMLEQGLLDEVQALYQRGDLSPELPSIRCVGYRQMWPVITGEEDLKSAREKAIIATRQLAKRQMTWLRSMPERMAVDCLDPSNAHQEILQALQSDLSKHTQN